MKHLYPILLCLAAALPCMAAPDFSHSTLTPRNPTPLAASVAVYDLVLRNTGDEGGAPLYVEMNWERVGFFVGITGLDSLELDPEGGGLRSYLMLPPGAEKKLSLEILCSREAKGDVLTLDLRLADFQHNSEYWDHAGITLEPQPHNGGIRVGPVIFTNAALMVLLGLCCALLAWAVFVRLERKSGSGKSTGAMGLTVLWMMPIGFWMFFGAMAWKDLQILNQWVETQGVILGRHMDVSSSSTQNLGVTRRSQNNTSYKISLALKFQDQGKTMYGSGYDPDSFLQIGGRKQREKEIREWTVGKTIPCWYNPEDPTEIVVKRGFGGAYFFALLPLPFFVFGLRAFRKRFFDT